MLAAVKKKACTLKWAAESVLRDRAFMLRAIALNEGALCFTPEHMRNDHEFMRSVNSK